LWPKQDPLADRRGDQFHLLHRGDLLFHGGLFVDRLASIRLAQGSTSDTDVLALEQIDGDGILARRIHENTVDTDPDQRRRLYLGRPGFSVPQNFNTL